MYFKSFQNLYLHTPAQNSLMFNSGRAYSPDIEATIQKHCQTLREKGYNHKQITTMMNHQDVERTIATTTQYHNDLIKSYNYDQITEIVTQPGGHLTLKAIVRHYPFSPEKRYTNVQVTKIAHCRGGSRRIIAAKLFYQLCPQATSFDVQYVTDALTSPNWLEFIIQSCNKSKHEITDIITKAQLQLRSDSPVQHPVHHANRATPQSRMEPQNYGWTTIPTHVLPNNATTQGNHPYQVQQPSSLPQVITHQPYFPNQQQINSDTTQRNSNIITATTSTSQIPATNPSSALSNDTFANANQSSKLLQKIPSRLSKNLQNKRASDTPLGQPPSKKRRDIPLQRGYSYPAQPQTPSDQFNDFESSFDELTHDELLKEIDWLSGQ